MTSRHPFSIEARGFHLNLQIKMSNFCKHNLIFNICRPPVLLTVELAEVSPSNMCRMSWWVAQNGSSLCSTINDQSTWSKRRDILEEPRPIIITGSFRNARPSNKNYARDLHKLFKLTYGNVHIIYAVAWKFRQKPVQSFIGMILTHFV